MSKNKVTESKVIVENGKVKTIFNEEIQQTGWMDIEEAERLTLQYFEKLEELNKME
jgi:hypothetical protein